MPLQFSCSAWFAGLRVVDLDGTIAGLRTAPHHQEVRIDHNASFGNFDKNDVLVLTCLI